MKGQYVDGHERSDVVAYCQQVFLPAWTHLQSRMQKWEVGRDNNSVVEDMNTTAPLSGGERHIVVWFHDESTFYANDQRKLQWVHQNESAEPQPKGEGASLMVADFVSADYGWLQSPDRKKHAHVLFKAGKARDGYFTNDDIVAQTRRAMDILSRHYPNEDHVFIFNNAKTHLKRANDSLSARKMPKFPSESWGVTIIAKDSTGKQIRDANGNTVKEKIRMVDARLPNGVPQPLYFPEGHERTGWFKGMAQILVERGYAGASHLPAECKDFKCPPDRTDCCCCRLMYGQSDFTNVESIIETTCRSCGFEVIFLPKFHCELNFIEQCWGFSKRVYRMKPRPSSEEMLECSVVESVEAVPLETMRQ